MAELLVKKVCTEYVAQRSRSHKRFSVPGLPSVQVETVITSNINPYARMYRYIFIPSLTAEDEWHA